jgi:hypothetical protein
MTLSDKVDTETFYRLFQAYKLSLAFRKTYRMIQHIQPDVFVAENGVTAPFSKPERLF